MSAYLFALSRLKAIGAVVAGGGEGETKNYGSVGNREKEPDRGVLRMGRPPRSMFTAISFRQNGHLPRVVTNVDPSESRETKNGTTRENRRRATGE